MTRFGLLLLGAGALAGTACAGDAADGARSARPPYQDSSRILGNGPGDTRGGGDMPERGRRGEHEHHAMTPTRR